MKVDTGNKMYNLNELNVLLRDAIYKLMDNEMTLNEAELSLLDVLTDACMEVEDFLYGEKTTAH